MLAGIDHSRVHMLSSRVTYRTWAWAAANATIGLIMHHWLRQMHLPQDHYNDAAHLHAVCRYVII